MNRLISFILISLGSLFHSVAQVSPLQLNGDDAASIGIVVRNLVTGQDIVSYNSKMLLCPASTMKLVTSAAALSTKGEEFTYTTSAYLSGKVIDGRAMGNIVIVPGGDPTLYSAHFEPEKCTFFSDIINNLKNLGVKEIAGDIIVADRYMPDQGPVSTWELEDIFYSYGAGYFDLNFSDNVFKLNTQTGEMKPFIPDAEIEIENIGTSRNIIHGLNSDKYIVTGPKVFETGSSVTMPMNNPATALVAALANEIERSRIVFVDGYDPIITDSIPLTCYHSKPLPDILHSLMVRSDNMMAESALRLLAPGQTRDSALVCEANFLKSIGVSTDFSNILDGSGLSRANSITPNFLADVLQKMTLSPVSKTFISLFPRAGLDGTMKSFLPNTSFTKRLVMKTGSMSGVRCYAGYLLNNNGRPTHVVVIMVNKYFGSSSDVKRSIEQFILSTLK